MRTPLVGLGIALSALTFTGGAGAEDRVATAAIAARKEALELDGAAAGWLLDAEGGHAHANVTLVPSADGGFRRKTLFTRYEPVALTFGAGLTSTFYGFVQDGFGSAGRPRSGTVIFTDAALTETRRLSWTNGRVAELRLPVLDIAATAPVAFTLLIEPERAQWSTPNKGTKATAQLPKPAPPLLLPGSFRLTIDGLDCTHVERIESLKVVRSSTRVDVSHLVLTLGAKSAQSWIAWHESFVINSNNGAPKEKGGTLEYLSPGRQRILFTVSFRGLALFKLQSEKATANVPSRWRAELTVAGATFAAPPTRF